MRISTPVVEKVLHPLLRLGIALPSIISDEAVQ